MEDREERISELGDRIEITQYEQQRENRLNKKMNRALGACGTITKDSYHHRCHPSSRRGERE